MKIGFAGLGLMGRPMGMNLLRAGTDLVVYNRSAGAREELRAAGAEVAETPAILFDASAVVMLMLANDEATDEVLGRGGSDFGQRVRGKLIINLGTHAPDYSRALEADIRAFGGEFVEAPVSGSRGPAEAGQLVAMVAGEPGAVLRARPLLQPLCRVVVPTGAVPTAMAMKMAVNLYLIASVSALAEAVGLAERLGLDLELFQQTINGGPMKSDVVTRKLAKMVSGDFSPEAAISDVYKNSALVAAAASQADAETPLLNESLRLFGSALSRGEAELDMAAVVRCFRA